MSRNILIDKYFRDRINLKKSFILSFGLHIFLIGAVSFSVIMSFETPEESPIINLKLANASQDNISNMQQFKNSVASEIGAFNNNTSTASITAPAMQIRRLDANSTMNTDEAKYLNLWQRQIENIGHQLLIQQYPQLTPHQMRITVSIDASGALQDIQIMTSSGNFIVDKLARQILTLASPYPSFPDSMSAQYQTLTVDRVWEFGQAP